MRTHPTSIRRRQFLIAGAVSVAAPAASWAGQGYKPFIDGPLVISGRVVDSTGRPLAGACVRIDAGHAVSGTTDGDGRFVVSTDAARASAIRVRVSDAQQTFSTDFAPAREALQRDESGTWRTTVGLALA